VFLDQALDLQAMFEDIIKRPFITAGFGAAVLLVPLAITSTRSSIRRLGFVRWQRLHQLAYLAGALGAVHFIWRVKVDVSQPVTYATALCLLLLVRVLYWIASRRAPSMAARGDKRRIVAA
jgi:sulfoxide reductase heme-binding subunit YedZ